jgi:26S proteasome regulatory subunit N1
MTAVPKPLKFLMPHYATLKSVFPNCSKANALLFADVLAVLGMVFGAEDARECLSFKLRGNSTDVASWGGEFARHITGEVGEEWASRGGASADPASVADLLQLVHVLVPYHLTHGAEHEAVDLLLQVHQLPLLLTTELGSGGRAPALAVATASEPGAIAPNAAAAPAVVDLDAPLQPHSRVCAYLLKCGSYSTDAAEALTCGLTAFSIHMAHHEASAALRVALHLGGPLRNERVAAVFASVGDNKAQRRQLAFQLARARAAEAAPAGALDSSLESIAGNLSLSESFAALARDLDTVEPKTPEDIFKSGDARGGEARMDSARANLAKTYVNGFVNVGYGADRLVTPPDSDWVFKNKDHGQTAAAASVGLVHLWNESQLSALDKFLEAGEDSVKAGGILGIALATAGTRNPDADAALALLCGYADHSDASVSAAQKSAALYGLGLAYTGTARDDVADLAVPFLSPPSGASQSIDAAAATTELAAMSSLCIGLVFCGTAHEAHATLISQRLLSTTQTEQNAAISRHLALGLALLFLGRGNAADTILEVLEALGDVPFKSTAAALVTSAAYAASGNAAAIQKLMRVCAQHPEMEEREQSRLVAEEAKSAAALNAARTAAAAGAGAAAAAAGAGAGAPSPPGPLALAAAASAATRGGLDLLAPSPPDRKGTDVSGRFMHQSVAVLGLGLVAAGESLSIDMAGRVSEHLLQYGDLAVRRAVPLALAMTHLSNPDYTVVDTLSKLSHDPCEDTCQAAILALGLVGAGTNNSRIAGLLRTLATFYKNEPSPLFITRIAQGLLHMGKVRQARLRRICGGYGRC